jgi:6,7-dimethyl-8-ribityllumazine synthase
LGSLGLGIARPFFIASGVRTVLMTSKKRLFSGKKVVVIVSSFNETVTQRLADACLDELHKQKVPLSQVKLIRVPGAFEIPLAAKVCARLTSVAAVICLGAVIKGQTDHYNLIVENVARGIMDVSIETRKPVIFEVLACETFQLADERSKAKGINKGRDAARTALEMIRVLQTV